MRSESYREGGEATTREASAGQFVERLEDADVTRSRESRDVDFSMRER